MHAIRQAFAQPSLLAVLAILPALAALALWARRKRRQALARFGPAALDMPRGGRLLRLVRRPSLLLGLLCLGLGMAGPRWGRDWDQAAAPGRDLMIVLDCSGSMRAETPSRLERARAALLDLAATLARSGGSRVGLVNFAGRARLVCPLTHDLDHFREAVEAIDLLNPDPELAPEGDDRSGTRIGRGLAAAVATLDRPGAARDVLLLSDGDDPARDGEWKRGVARARAAGVPVHCVGIGDPDGEHKVPLGDGWLTHDGRPVTTRLEEAPLREIANQTGGVLSLPGTRPLPLGEYYLGTIATHTTEGETDGGPDALPVYRLRYPWLLLPAFVLLSLTLVLPDRRGVPALPPRLP
jgi:Ca-activated chloride channel family protein